MPVQKKPGEIWRPQISLSCAAERSCPRFGGADKRPFIMSRSLAKILPVKPPKELLRFLEDPPLVGDEKPEDYNNVFSAIVIAAKPSDAIDWFYIKDVADLTWEIRRERAIKVGIIKLMQKEVVLDLLKTTGEDPSSFESHMYRIFSAANDAERWSLDSQANEEINSKLAARGYPTSAVLAQACIEGAAQIDAVDRRIASYEMRKMLIIREIERRNERLSRRLEKASSEIIEAEFSEAAE
jgi:hypothetical protein